MVVAQAVAGSRPGEAHLCTPATPAQNAQHWESCAPQRTRRMHARRGRRRSKRWATARHKRRRRRRQNAESEPHTSASSTLRGKHRSQGQAQLNHKRKLMGGRNHKTFDAMECVTATATATNHITRSVTRQKLRREDPLLDRTRALLPTTRIVLSIIRTLMPMIYSYACNLLLCATERETVPSPLVRKGLWGSVSRSHVGLLRRRVRKGW